VARLQGRTSSYCWTRARARTDESAGSTGRATQYLPRQRDSLEADGTSMTGLTLQLHFQIPRE
jgi:hypothetical protein